MVLVLLVLVLLVLVSVFELLVGLVLLVFDANYDVDVAEIIRRLKF